MKVHLNLGRISKLSRCKHWFSTQALSESVSKRKYAFTVGYLGSNYTGFQIDKSRILKTVEGELEKSIYESGYMRESNFGDLSKVGWSRSSRTDKGVHAAQMIFTCKVEVKSSEVAERMPQIVENLNSKLPQDIRVFSSYRCTNGFAPKDNCHWREYEYLFPLSFLEKLQNSHSISNPTELVEKLNLSLKKFQGTHDFHNFHNLKDSDILKKSEHNHNKQRQTLDPQLLSRITFTQHEKSEKEEEKEEEEEESAMEFREEDEEDNDDEENENANEIIKEKVNISSNLSNQELNSFSPSTSSPFPSFSSSTSPTTTTPPPPTTPTSHSRLPLKSYFQSLGLLSSKTIEKEEEEEEEVSVLSLMNKYSPTDGSVLSQREGGGGGGGKWGLKLRKLHPQVRGKIYHCQASLIHREIPSFSSSSSPSNSSSSSSSANSSTCQVPLVSIRILGKSFLYNQIRLMVGAALVESSGNYPSYSIDLALLSQLHVPFPLAPAEGLCLKNAGFLKNRSNSKNIHEDYFMNPSPHMNPDQLMNCFMTEKETEEMNRFHQQRIQPRMLLDWLSVLNPSHPPSTTTTTSSPISHQISPPSLPPVFVLSKESSIRKRLEKSNEYRSLIITSTSSTTTSTTATTSSSSTSSPSSPSSSTSSRIDLPELNSLMDEAIYRMKDSSDSSPPDEVIHLWEKILPILIEKKQSEKASRREKEIQRMQRTISEFQSDFLTPFANEYYRAKRSTTTKTTTKTTTNLSYPDYSLLKISDIPNSILLSFEKSQVNKKNPELVPPLHTLIGSLPKTSTLLKKIKFIPKSFLIKDFFPNNTYTDLVVHFNLPPGQYYFHCLNVFASYLACGEHPPVSSSREVIEWIETHGGIQKIQSMKPIHDAFLHQEK